MNNVNLMVGLPWQLAEIQLQAACIPYKIRVGNNYNRFFPIAVKGYYVGRVKNFDTYWEILLYKPMVYSDFENSDEVEYAKEFIGQE